MTENTCTRHGWTPAIDAKQDLDPRLGPDRATDIASVVHSHEAFLALTDIAGWSVEEYKAWSYETLCDQLLVDGRGKLRPLLGGLRRPAFHFNVWFGHPADLTPCFDG